jgi:hypothetical protein
MSDLNELIEFKRNGAFTCLAENARAVFAPDLGARVFCELDGLLLHRLDLENVRDPNRPFNNFGGNNFWPAPEGGRFGFNYEGNTWRVQPALNDQPFLMEATTGTSARARKETTLRNRQGLAMDVIMQREFAVVPLPGLVADLWPRAAFAYTVEDQIEVVSRIKTEDALVACWTLEQFEASEGAVSFARVQQPGEAINFDFYDHPGDRISYGTDGFLYKTDGRSRGQIGIRKGSAPEFIGFYDLQRQLLCIREIVGACEGLYFNIADNDQPRGSFSAADAYSIFNGDETLGFFELETVGGAQVQDGYLKGSRLRSRTSFARFDQAETILRFVDSMIRRYEE